MECLGLTLHEGNICQTAPHGSWMGPQSSSDFISCRFHRSTTPKSIVLLIKCRHHSSVCGIISQRLMNYTDSDDCQHPDYELRCSFLHRWGGTAMNDCLRSDAAAITRMLHLFGGRPGIRTPPGVPPSTHIEKVSEIKSRLSQLHVITWTFKLTPAYALPR